MVDPAPCTHCSVQFRLTNSNVTFSVCLISTLFHHDSNDQNTGLWKKATSTTVDARGRAPMLANVVKFVKRNNFQKDQDSIVKFIGENTEDWFYYIVTRPGLTRESASKKRLAASKSVSEIYAFARLHEFGKSLFLVALEIITNL